MSETNENQEPGAVGSDSNEGLGGELTAAYFAGFHKRDDELKRYREALNKIAAIDDRYDYEGWSQIKEARTLARKVLDA